MDTFERRRIYFRCVQFPKIKMKNHVYKNHVSPSPLNNLLLREKQTNKISVDIGSFVFFLVFFLCFKWIAETSFIAWHKVRHLQTKVSQPANVTTVQLLHFSPTGSDWCPHSPSEGGRSMQHWDASRCSSPVKTFRSTFNSQTTSTPVVSLSLARCLD